MVNEDPTLRRCVCGECDEWKPTTAEILLDSKRLTVSRAARGHREMKLICVSTSDEIQDLFPVSQRQSFQAERAGCPTMQMNKVVRRTMRVCVYR